ncbi:MAG: DUF2953 domain-containing protein [Hyphomonadaceae bacterium]|nr:DUF2953 domain-containing protein [Clostridia bacterium]
MIFTIAVIFVIAFIVLLFTVALKIKFIFDTQSENVNLNFKWLYPLLEVVCDLENLKPILTVYLFKKKVYKKMVQVKKQKNKGNGMNFAKKVQAKDVHVSTYYGLSDPCATGIACGIMNIVTPFIKPTTMKYYPDFTADDEYIYVDATAKVNVGATLIHIMRKNALNPY